MHVCFYAPVPDRSFLDINEFYAQDLRILREVSGKLVTATRWHEVPLDADVYFIWWWTRAFVPMSKALPLRRPCIVTGVFDFDNPIPGMGFNSRPWHQRKLISLTLRSANCNLFLTEFERARVTSALAPRSAMLAGLVVDAQTYRYAGGTREPFLLTVGWLHGEAVRRKGIDTAIRSHAEVLRKYPEMRLCIAGTPGDAVSALKDLAASLGSEPKVEFLGRIDTAQKIRLLQTCSAYLQLSIFEGFGMAAAEAMACGAPVVAYPVGTLPEVLGPGAYFVDERTPSAVSLAIEHAMLEPDAARLQAAAASVVDRYSYARRRAAIVQAIAEVRRA